MRDCEAMQERLSALLDGELDETEAGAVRAHLEHCADCRAFYAAMQELSGLLEPEPVPADLHGNIMARFDQRERVLARQKRLGRLRPLFSLAAAAAILVGTVLTLGRGALHFGKQSAAEEQASTYSVAVEAMEEPAEEPERNELVYSAGLPQEPTAPAATEAPDAVAECEEADCDEAAPETDGAEPKLPAAAARNETLSDAEDKSPESASDAAVPADFSFALTWGAYGISSYDSATGKLVKTTDASHPEDYVTYHTLTEEESERIFDLIAALNVFSYPTEYDPGNGSSEPSITLILTVRFGGETRTIRAENISLSMTSNDEKGQAFLNVCREISDMLTETPEWAALPDYERLYD
ncbi:MAG: zf-HC2 domain-containing protein [Oscillospiraceae bacterium]|nr:zf-HC2 domain-containing protein [Oscillospiraceae bacterium]